MGYDSVDKLQNLLASEVFHYTNDRKKAAGRALGTFVELITYLNSLPKFYPTGVGHSTEGCTSVKRLEIA